MLLADAYLHTLDPFAIKFPDGWFVPGIRWYGLSYAAGFVVGWIVVYWMARTKRSLIEPQRVGDLMTAIIVGVLVGGRLGYVLFYDPSLWGFSSSLPYWDVLAINKGGMSSHGGIIGVVLACVWFARRSQIPSLHVLDVAAFIAAPGLCFGRLANFVNGELLGHPIPGARQATAPWWSVKFPQEIVLQAPPDLPPEELDAKVTTLREVAAQFTNLEPGWDYQLIDAVQQGNQDAAAALEPLLTARYPSQLIQAVAEGPALLLLLVLVWLAPRKPGVIGSWFLVGYGVMRIATEHFRMPDVGVELLMGLSRGRVLSVAMILSGVAVLIVTRHRAVERIGGLRRPQSGFTPNVAS